MDRERLQLLIGHLKRAFRKNRRLTVEEFYQLLDLAEAIMNYGRMSHSYHGSVGAYVIVDIPQLAGRFRETPQVITDALQLLMAMGRVEPAGLHGRWKLQVAATLLSDCGEIHRSTDPDE